jgi:hypothetical protein
MTKNFTVKKIFCFDQKLLFTYPYASKDAQADGEALSPQKRTSSTLKHEISLLFLHFVGNFCPAGSGSVF